MSRKKPGAGIDERIGAFTERAARRLSRRDAVRRVIVGGTTGLAALAMGASPAQASTCVCGPTRRCARCPAVGCPPGHHLCRGSFRSHCFNSQGYRCEWPSGSWIACMNLGKGLGYKVCYDCIGAGGCREWCTCLSACICCHCAGVADIRAEQHRVQHAEQLSFGAAEPGGPQHAGQASPRHAGQP
ncbi:MAG TPA: hypothetical protein VNF47_15180 [Streptosporangiaceae bacterium]|nr:hypothetical protein [Streptosporangiaceae bacterium]